MALAQNIIPVINMVLCAAILLLGYWGYTKKRDRLFLLIGISFGLFGVSHLITLLGYAVKFESLLIVLRLVAYILVIIALYKVAIGGKKKIK